jgi:hypothetical protein
MVFELLPPELTSYWQRPYIKFLNPAYNASGSQGARREHLWINYESRKILR